MKLGQHDRRKRCNQSQWPVSPPAASCSCSCSEQDTTTRPHSARLESAPHLCIAVATCVNQASSLLSPSPSSSSSDQDCCRTLCSGRRALLVRSPCLIMRASVCANADPPTSARQTQTPIGRLQAPECHLLAFIGCIRAHSAHMAGIRDTAVNI